MIGGHRTLDQLHHAGPVKRRLHVVPAAASMATSWVGSSLPGVDRPGQVLRGNVPPA